MSAQRLSSALARVLQAVVPPGGNHITPTKANDQSDPTNTGSAAAPSIALIKVRWPASSSTDVNGLTQSLCLHDLLMLAVNAIVLMHGATVIPSKNIATTQAGKLSSAAPYQFLPTDWNGNRLVYSFNYALAAPVAPGDSERDSEHDPSNSEVLAADGKIGYTLTVKATPINDFLLVTAQLYHVSDIDSVSQSGAKATIAMPVKMTFKCRDYVNIDRLTQYLAAHTGTFTEEKGNEAKRERLPSSQSLPADVFANLGRLVSAVSNGLIKRSLGALWTVIVHPHSAAAHYNKPYLPDLPVDIMVSILSFLSSRELVTLGTASSSLYDSSCMPLLWHLLCQSELPATRERAFVDPTSWKNEFLIRLRLLRQERERNKFALVPIGDPMAVIDVQRREGPPRFYPSFLNPAVNDPLGLGDWRRAGGVQPRFRQW